MISQMPPGAWSDVWGGRPVGGGGLFFSFSSFCFNIVSLMFHPHLHNPTLFLKVGIRERPLLVHCLSDTGIMCYQVFFRFSRDEFIFILTKSMTSGSATGDAGQTGRARGCLGLVPRTKTWDHYSQVILILVMIVLLVVIDMIRVWGDSCTGPRPEIAIPNVCSGKKWSWCNNVLTRQDCHEANGRWSHCQQ